MAQALTSSLLQPAGVPRLSAFKPRSTAARPVRRTALAPVAMARKAPEGVTQPPVVPETPLLRFGFVDWAEKMNSRAAMIGFFALLAVEAIAGKGLLELMGLTIGNGLPFEF